MKKNKTIAYALAATLLVGGTFAGTKALFSDNVDSKSDLVITTGRLDLQIDEASKWKPEGVNEIKNPNEDNNFINVRPGDSFIKTVSLTNKGSLDMDITSNTVVDKLEDDFNVTIEGLDTIKSIKPTESKTFNIKVKVSENMKNGDGNSNHNTKFSLSDQIDTINITGESRTGEKLN